MFLFVHELEHFIVDVRSKSMYLRNLGSFKVTKSLGPQIANPQITRKVGSAYRKYALCV
jgi:hypothetical protein